MLDFQYQEVKTKKGSIIVFCNLEKLLLEYFNVADIESVNSMSKKSGNEYIIHCPFCKEEGHTKHKLYIKDDLSVGHCFVCCRSFVNSTDEIKLRISSPNFLYFMNNNKPFELVKLNDPIWSLDKFETEFDTYDEKGIRYLKNRHPFMDDLYKVLKFKFFDGNVVIPFFRNGELIYYQIRFTGNSSIKYYFPPISAKPIYCIERGEEFKHKIIIVEGVFDAIAALIQCPDYMPVAVLGSSISDYQIEYLRDYCKYLKEIRIWMDETKISIGIANKLKTVIDYCPINIIKSYGPDPEEVMVSRIQNNLPLQWIHSITN